MSEYYFVALLTNEQFGPQSPGFIIDVIEEEELKTAITNITEINILADEKFQASNGCANNG